MRLSSRDYLACIALIVIGAAVTLVALKPKLVEPIKILSDIEVAQARVAESGTVYTSNNTESYHFRYTFEVDGKNYSGTSPFGELPNEVEPVQYMRSNPAKNSPQLAGHAYIDIFIFCVPMVFTIVMFTILIRHHWSRQV